MTFPGAATRLLEKTAFCRPAWQYTIRQSAREFAATHDMKVKNEIERMAKEYGRLKEPWVFVAS